MPAERRTEWCLYWGGEDANDAAMVEVYATADEAIADQRWKGGLLSWRWIAVGAWHVPDSEEATP